MYNVTKDPEEKHLFPVMDESPLMDLRLGQVHVVVCFTSQVGLDELGVVFAADDALADGTVLLHAGKPLDL